MDAATLPAVPRREALLDRVFDAIFARPATFLVLGAATMAVAGVQEAWLAGDAGVWRFALTLVTGQLVWSLAQLGAAHAVAGWRQGAPPALGATLAATLRLAPAAAGTGLLYLAGAAFWSLLLVVPGMVWAVSRAFAIQALAATGSGGPAALGRSRQVTRGRWWRTLGLLTLLFLPSVLLSVLFDYLPSDPLRIALHAAIGAVLLPIPLAGLAVVYLDREEQLAAAERLAARRALESAAGPAAPVFAAPAHAAFDAGAFSAFEHRGWQRAAADYHRAFSPLTRQAIEPLLDAAGVGPGARVLDVGCGPGDLSAAAAARGAAVIGADFAPEMLAIARGRHPGIEFRVADAEALPFPDGGFDAVVMGFLAGHLSHAPRAFAEGFRVLRPGGRYAHAWWQAMDRAIAFGAVWDAVRSFGRLDVGLPQGPPFDRYTDPEELGRELSLAGFADVRIEPVPLVWRVPDGDTAFDAFLAGTVRTAGLLREQSPDALLAIRARVVGRLEEFREPDGLAIPTPCWVASGLKPPALFGRAAAG